MISPDSPRHSVWMEAALAAIPADSDDPDTATAVIQALAATADVGARVWMDPVALAAMLGPEDPTVEALRDLISDRRIEVSGQGLIRLRFPSEQKATKAESDVPMPWLDTTGLVPTVSD